MSIRIELCQQSVINARSSLVTLALSVGAVEGEADGGDDERRRRLPWS